MSNTDDLAGRESLPTSATDRDLLFTPSAACDFPFTLPTRQESVLTSSSYGSAEISGNSRVHQGDSHQNNHSTIHIDQLVQFRLPYEIISPGTYNAYLRQRLAPLNTNHNYVGDSNRGRDHKQRHRDNSPYRHDFSRSSPRSSSRSSSSTRHSRSNFPSRGRRRSSASRDRRHTDYSTPISSVASSGNSMLSFKEEAEIRLPIHPTHLPVHLPRHLDRTPSTPSNKTQTPLEDNTQNGPPKPASVINSSPVIDMAVPPDKKDNGWFSFAEARKKLQDALKVITDMEEQLSEKSIRRDRKRTHSWDGSK